MSDFDDEIKKRAEQLRSAREEQRVLSSYARELQRAKAENFRDLLAMSLSTHLVRFDLNKVEDELDLEDDDEIELILLQTEYLFGKISIEANKYRFEPTDWRHQELDSVEGAEPTEFIARLRPVLLEYLAAVEAEEEEDE